MKIGRVGEQKFIIHWANRSWRSTGIALALSKLILLPAALAETPARASNCQSLFQVVASRLEPEAIDRSPFSIVIGDPMQVVIPGKEGPIEALFVGRMPEADGRPSSMLFFEEEKKILHVLPAESVNLEGAKKEVMAIRQAQPVLSPNTQKNRPYCMGYSMQNCLLNLKNWESEVGSSSRKLNADQLANYGSLESQAGRKRLLERGIDAYYFSWLPFFAEKNLIRVARDYGFTVEKLSVDRSLIPSLVESIEAKNSPVIISFHTRKPYPKTYQVIEYAKSGEAAALDNRVNLPATKSTAGSGGQHAVVIVNTFTDSAGARKFLVLDPNWDVPRVWDAADFNGADLGDLEAWSVK